MIFSKPTTLAPRLLLAVPLAAACAAHLTLADASKAAEQALRVATYNVSLYRPREGQLAHDLEQGDPQARQIAAVLQRVRPDVVLLNEFDYDANHRSAQLFCSQYLAQPQDGERPIEYAYRFTEPVNTGEPSHLDLDQDGDSTGPGDAYGWGAFPGQYGMLVLSKYPIDTKQVRTFRRFLWHNMPDHLTPRDPHSDRAYYTDEVFDSLRLSSKSFWDVPIEVPMSGSTRTLHLLCSHPTPPVFDGPEDRNGMRNHDEVRLLADYVDGQKGSYLVDDTGGTGGLPSGEAFVIAGDLNADPLDGDAYPGAIAQLLEHPSINASKVPASAGGPYYAQQNAELNRSHQGAPENDTTNFSHEGHGNLRLDYVLPSRNFQVIDLGVFWPLPTEPGGKAATASDHRLVWMDLQLSTPPQATPER